MTDVGGNAEKPAKKSPAEKSPAEKGAAKKAPAKKSATKKAPAKKSATKKAPARKGATKKAPAKKSAAKKAGAKKGAAKKAQGTTGAAPRTPTVAPEQPAGTGPTPVPPEPERSRRSAVAGSAASRARMAPTSRYFRRARERAGHMVDHPERLERLAAETSRTAGEGHGPLVDVLDDLKAMIRLVVAYARGTYREVPTETLVLVVAALVYVAMPIDVIPDVIPVVGYLDDAVVVGWVLKHVRDEVHTFRAWETRTSAGG